MTKIETMDISKCIDVIDTMVQFGHLNQYARLTLIMSRRHLEEKKQKDRMVCGNCEKLREDGWCSFYKYYNAGGYVFYHEPNKCDYCRNFDPKEDCLIERKNSVMSESKCMDDAGEYYKNEDFRVAQYKDNRSEINELERLKKRINNQRTEITQLHNIINEIKNQDKPRSVSENANKIVKELQELLPEKIDYAKLVGAEGSSYGHHYIWEEPEPYIVQNGIDLIISQQDEIDRIKQENEKLKELVRLAVKDIAKPSVCECCNAICQGNEIACIYHGYMDFYWKHAHKLEGLEMEVCRINKK